MVRYGEGVELNDGPWNGDVLCVGTIVENQIFAQVLLTLLAVEAPVAGCRVVGNHPHAGGESFNTGSCFRHHTDTLMPESAGRVEQTVPAIESLQVSAAGGCTADFEEYLPIGRLRYGDASKLKLSGS